MRQYTTPSILITVEGIDLTSFDIWVTFTQGAHVLTVQNPPMELDSDGNTVLTVKLSQCDTAGFKVGMLKIQVNWLDEFGERNASRRGIMSVDSNLLDRVLP